MLATRFTSSGADWSEPIDIADQECGAFDVDFSMFRCWTQSPKKICLSSFIGSMNRHPRAM